MQASAIPRVRYAVGWGQSRLAAQFELNKRTPAATALPRGLTLCEFVIRPACLTCRRCGFQDWVLIQYDPERVRQAVERSLDSDGIQHIHISLVVQPGVPEGLGVLRRNFVGVPGGFQGEFEYEPEINA